MDDDLEEVVRLVTQVRARRALIRARATAAAGLDALSKEEIDREIRAARKARKRRAS